MENGMLTYVYVIYEVTGTDPKYSKVGHSREPLKRLRTLQTGNPRLLRVAMASSSPGKRFSFPLPSEALAKELEGKVLQYYRESGVNVTGTEWIEGVDPEAVWNTVLDTWAAILKEHAIDLSQLKEQVEVRRQR